MYIKRTLAYSLITASLIFLLPAIGCSSRGNVNVGAGMTCIEEQKYDEALSNFDKALTEGEDKELTYRGRGIALMGLCRYDEAAASFEEALHNGGSVPGDIDFDINYYLAVCYARLGRYEDAIARYNAIAEIKPKWPDTYFLRGVVELQSGDKTSAITDFDKSVELDKKNYGRYIDIYCELLAAGYEGEGRSYLQTAIDSNDKSMSDYDKGRLYFYMGDYTNARNHLEVAKSSGKKTEDVILLCGRAYENSGDRDYALDIYREYVEATPSAAVYNRMGLLLTEMGEFEEAESAFSKGLELGDVSCRQQLLFNRAVANERKGDFAKAASLMQEYLSLYPDDEEAKREYSFLQTR